MRTGDHIVMACADHVTTLHVDHGWLEGPGWLYKLPERLMKHVRPWNLDVPALGVIRALATSGDGNDDTHPTSLQWLTLIRTVRLLSTLLSIVFYHSNRNSKTGA